jgi:O-antigen/teichoic acid export membrane protein
MTRERNRRIVLTSGAGVTQRAAQAAATVVTFPLVIRALGVDGFGVWGAATSLAWVAWMLDLGLGAALVTLVPRALAGEGGEGASDLVAAALAGAAGLSLAFVGMGWAGMWLAGRPVDPPFVVAAAALALNVPLGIGSRLWLALQKGYAASGWELAQTVITLALLVAGALLGLGVTALTACVYGAMLAANAGGLAHVLIAHPELRPRRWPGRRATRRVTFAAAPMLGISVANACALVFDNTLALVWLGPAASAQMAIALRLITTASGFISVIGQAFWPAFAEAAATGDRSWMRRSLRDGTLIVAGLALAGSLALAAVGGPLLRLWLGRDLGMSGPVLWAVGAWVTLSALTLAPGYLLLAVSRLKGPLIVLTVAALVGLALKYLAAQRFGVAGMLTVTPALTVALVWPVYLWMARAWLADGFTHPSGGRTAL